MQEIRPHDEVMAENFSTDPAYAFELAAEILRVGDLREAEILRRQLVKSLNMCKPKRTN